MNSTSEPQPSISEDRLSAFRDRLQQVFRDRPTQQSLATEELIEFINHAMVTDELEPFAQNEFDAAVERMVELLEIMVADGEVYMV